MPSCVNTSRTGNTWEPLETILDPNTLPGCNKTEACLPYTEACQWSSVKTGKVCGGGCAVWDPTPVVDNVTGEVHVLFSRTKSSCLGSTYPAFPGQIASNHDLWIMTSSDFGSTWSHPRNITDDCSNPYGGTVTGGEGHGIQIDSTGQLIIPLYWEHDLVKPPVARQGVCTSRDHGKTWRSAGYAEAPNGEFGGPYEGEIVELFEKTATGTPLLMYDVRISTHGDFCQNGQQQGNCRATFLSDDLGMTWTNATAHPEMPDPSCKGKKQYYCQLSLVWPQ